MESISRKRTTMIASNDKRNRTKLAMAAGLLLLVSLLSVAALVGSGQLGGSASSEPELKEFHLVAKETEVELQPGLKVKAWTYNGTMPGPEIRVNEGDHVRVTLTNELPTATTIHFHGVDLPNDMDGPAGLSQAPVEPGDSFVYDFIATPGGTRWYHTHTDVASQILLGLYGAFIVEPKHEEKVDRDYTYILTEWDAELTPDVALGNEPRGKRDQELRGGEYGTDYFLMNGKMNDAIDPIVVTEGDKVRIRLINAGNVPHPFHIHGHSFKIVATDGNPVPKDCPTDQGHGAGGAWGAVRHRVRGQQPGDLDGALPHREPCRQRDDDLAGIRGIGATGTIGGAVEHRGR